jgi:hypothetical protein
VQKITDFYGFCKEAPRIFERDFGELVSNPTPSAISEQNCERLA